MKYADQMASGAMMYMPSLITIISDIKEILRFILQQIGICNVGITNGEEFMKYAFEIASNGMIYVPSFIKIG
jgi:hypothetical protein